MKKEKRNGATKARSIQILEAAMVVGNAEHEAAFLEPIPHDLQGDVRASLAHRGLGRIWDRETKRDFWIASDGRRAMCLTLAGLDMQEAAQVRSYFDEHFLDRLGDPVAFKAELLVDIVRALRAEGRVS
jgi:hypothetical protein